MHIFYSDSHYVGNWPFSVEGVFPRMLGPRLPFRLGPQHLPPMVSCLVYILFEICQSFRWGREPSGGWMEEQVSVPWAGVAGGS